MKDPAFLFYSKDFYEGTRTLLPEERACYIDLMIYQHQHEIIPLDLKRVLLYCNGISEATLKATLDAKFIKTDNGYYNEKLNNIIIERKEFSNKQSINGVVGQFWKKSKAILDRKTYVKLKEQLSDKTNDELFELINGENIDRAYLEALLEALLKHLAIGDEDKINIDYTKYDKEIYELSKLLIEVDFIHPYIKPHFLAYMQMRVNAKKGLWKTVEGLKTTYEQLQKYSDKTVGVAINILKQSIANEWQGIFPLKNQ